MSFCVVDTLIYSFIAWSDFRRQNLKSKDDVNTLRLKVLEIPPKY